MIQIMLNGTETTLAENTVTAILILLGLNDEPRGFAIALNDTVVPRSTWHTVMLCEHDRVEVIGAMQGG
jgi:sulfur carrier protein